MTNVDWRKQNLKVYFCNTQTTALCCHVTRSVFESSSNTNQKLFRVASRAPSRPCAHVCRQCSRLHVTEVAARGRQPTDNRQLTGNSSWRAALWLISVFNSANIFIIGWKLIKKFQGVAKFHPPHNSSWLRLFADGGCFFLFMFQLRLCFPRLGARQPLAILKNKSRPVFVRSEFGATCPKSPFSSQTTDDRIASFIRGLRSKGNNLETAKRCRQRRAFDRGSSQWLEA